MKRAMRDAYADVGRALRASNAAARRADLNVNAWRVLSVVHDQLASYSLLSASVPNSLITLETGLSRGTVWRAINKLADAGAITYSPGDGTSASTLSLPDTTPRLIEPPPDTTPDGSDSESEDDSGSAAVSRLGRDGNTRSGARAYGRDRGRAPMAATP